MFTEREQNLRTFYEYVLLLLPNIFELVFNRSYFILSLYIFTYLLRVSLNT